MNKEDIRFNLLIRLMLCVALLFVSITGGILNLTVVTTNGGKMPVYCETRCAISSEKHFIYNDHEDINFFYLADNFAIGYIAFSVGDILIFASMPFIFYQAYKIKKNLNILKRFKR
jgi:hypothetical protein